MTDRMRDELDRLCGKVERAFPEVVCAYDGFARQRMPAEDRDLVVEVFLAPRGSARRITRLTHEDARAISRALGVSVAVVVHYVHDTFRYYIDDVFSVLAAREGNVAAHGRPFPIFDAGASGSHTVWGEVTPMPANGVRDAAVGAGAPVTAGNVVELPCGG
jgi:hypothetical protein